MSLQAGPIATLGSRADLAQLVEHLHGKEGVIGSSPIVGFRSFQGFLLSHPEAGRSRGTKRVRPRRAIGGGQLSRSRLFIYVSPITREEVGASSHEATFLRPSEVAELTGLSTRAIYRAIERGELGAARLCSRLRIPRAAFHEWVERCAVQAAEPRPTTYPPVPPPRTGSFRSLLAHRQEKPS